jgi:hypothetical protein
MPRITFQALIDRPTGVETIMFSAEGASRQEVFSSARRQCIERGAALETVKALSLHNTRTDWSEVFAPPEDPHVMFIEDGWFRDTPYLEAKPNLPGSDW